MLTATAPRGKVARTSATLSRVLRYENEAVVAKIMKEHRLNHDDAYALFKDTLRFLWLAVTAGRIVPTKKLDKGWHTFILFTMDYQKFCHKYFGQFIHHRPNRPGDVPDGGEAVRMSQQLIAEYLGKELSKNWRYAAQASRCNSKGTGCCKDCCTH